MVHVKRIGRRKIIDVEVENILIYKDLKHIFLIVRINFIKLIHF